MNYSKISRSSTILLLLLFTLKENSAEADSISERINKIVRNTPTTEACANKDFLYESRGKLILHFCAHRCWGVNTSANVRDLDLQRSSIEPETNFRGYSSVVIPCRSGACVTDASSSIFGANEGQGCGDDAYHTSAGAKFNLLLLDRDADEVLNLVHKLQ